MRLLKLVPDHTNVDFMRWRNLAVILSTLMTVASLAYTAYRGLNMGVDFVGGQMIRVSFAQPINVEQLRGRVDSLQLGESSIQEFGGPKTYQIRLPKASGGDAAANVAATRVKTMVTSNYPGARIDSVESVSGKVSEELAKNGAMAIIFAMLGIAIYIWFRFEWQFGVSGIVALLHDVVTAIGLFSIFHIEFNLTSVAAILTIAGYSINDTVVVFDRVRENMRKYKSMPLVRLLNLTVNETLSRTLLTSTTTLIAVIMLFLFGGEVIHGFSLAMIWGILIGTYSSIWVAAALLIYFGVKRSTVVRDEAPAGAATAPGE
jgi:preprotein translocase subunit SecF